MKKDKESKEKAAEDNARLKARLAEMEKSMEGLKMEAALGKDRVR